MDAGQEANMDYECERMEKLCDAGTPELIFEGGDRSTLLEGRTLLRSRRNVTAWTLDDFLALPVVTDQWMSEPRRCTSVSPTSPNCGTRAPKVSLIPWTSLPRYQTTQTHET